MTKANLLPQPPDQWWNKWSSDKRAWLAQVEAMGWRVSEFYDVITDDHAMRVDKDGVCVQFSSLRGKINPA